ERVLPNSFTQQARGLLYTAASAAAVRLERLVGEDVKRVGSRARLTARELSVLRQASDGKSLQEIAKALHLGEETVRSHFKKAQTKLGTRNRTQTVAEAIRHLLIICLNVKSPPSGIPPAPRSGSHLVGRRITIVGACLSVANNVASSLAGSASPERRPVKSLSRFGIVTASPARLAPNRARERSLASVTQCNQCPVN